MNKISFLAAAALIAVSLPQSVMAAEPVQVSTESELRQLADEVNAGNECRGVTVTLTGDIQLTGEWTPIGGIDNKFCGIFDGNGYTISGIAVSSTEWYQGLFGVIGSGGKVKNLTAEGSVNAGGAKFVGGIAGLVSNGGIIEDCQNKVTVTGLMAGGVAGQTDGTVQRCYNSGSVTAGGEACQAGGICGNISGSVADCYNTGAVSISGGTSSPVAGGICGWLSGTIENCYNIGSVSGASFNGLIVGNCNDTGVNVSGCFVPRGTGLTALGIRTNAQKTQMVPATVIPTADFSDFSRFTDAGWDSSVWAIAECADFTRPVLISAVEDGARFAAVMAEKLEEFTSESGEENERQASLWKVTVSDPVSTVTGLSIKMNGVASDKAVSTNISGSGSVSIGVVVNLLGADIDTITAVLDGRIDVAAAIE